MHTLQSLKSQLSKIGLNEGALVMVHASLRKIGAIEGRGETLIEALIETIGAKGTLVMILGSPARAWMVSSLTWFTITSSSRFNGFFIKLVYHVSICNLESQVYMRNF